MNPTRIQAIVARQQANLFNDLIACTLTVSALIGGTLSLVLTLRGIL